MPLRSMTGFARADGTHQGTTWHWELRGVNGRGFDLRLRLPPGCEALEAPVREACGKRIVRGNVTVTLNLARSGGGAVIRLNEEALRQVADAAKRARQICPAGPLSLDGLLALRGVLEVSEPLDDEAARKALHEAMLASLQTALEDLTAARGREGKRLADVLTAEVDEIESLTRTVEASPARTPAEIERRLGEQVQRLFQASPALEPQRLHQEAMLLAVKADVEEELQRLKSHVAEARHLLATEEPVGRKLDFLAQELFREANTLCAKSNDTEITRIGMRLKVLIDQMREQVQNIE